MDAVVYGGVERRAAFRGRTLLSGKLIIGDSTISPDCLIRNLTDRGAHIRVSPAIKLPRTFGLLLIKEGMLFDATMVWRLDDKLGLTFSGRHDLRKDIGPERRGARALLAELSPR